MERLTARDKDGVYYPKCFEQCGGDPDGGDCLNCRFDEEIAERLAEYEDTGHTPADIVFLEKFFPDANFIFAKATGRLAVLPCRIGATVYGAKDRWIGTVEEISINSEGIVLYVFSGGAGRYVRPDEVVFKDT